MIYVASPYTHKSKKVMQQRYEAVCKFCAHMARQGYFVYSPIAHWHPIAITYNLSKDSGYWRRHNINSLRRSEELWVLKLKGWAKSTGISNEIEIAKINNIKTTLKEEYKECIT